MKEVLENQRLYPDDVFKSDHLGNDLVGKSVRGGMTTMTSQGIQFALSIVSTMILARMLTPDDFGLIGMVAVITGFVTMFKNAGLSMATIQKKSIAPEQISALFWINFLISLCLGVGLIICSPFIADFYGRPELIGINIVLSVSFIINGASIQHMALLYRHMRLNGLAIIHVTSQIISLVIAVVLAWYNFGYWALAVSLLSGTIVNTSLTFYFCPWKPGRFRRGNDIRSMLAFGGNLTVSNVANYISGNMDNVLIGRYWGGDALGLYAKAYQLFFLTIKQLKEPLQNTAMPTLSSLNDQPERYSRYYRRFLDILASLTIPLAAYCFIEAAFVIRFFLGPQWEAAIPVFRIFAILALIYPLAGTQSLVMISQGKSRRFLWWGIVTGVLSVIAFAIGLPYNIEGVAVAFTVMNYLVLVPSLYFSYHETPVTVTLFFRTIFPYFLMSSLATFGAITVSYFVGNDSLLVHLLILIVFGVIYVILSYRFGSLRVSLDLVRRHSPIYLGKW